MIKTYLIQILCSVAGAYGFSLVFHLKKDKIPLAALGGGLTWLVYLLFYGKLQNSFMAYFWATVFATFYAELMARILKAPVTIFVIPAVISLIPGGNLYYTMESLIQNNTEMLREKATETALLAFAIAMGITVVIMLLDIFSLFAGNKKSS